MQIYLTIKAVLVVLFSAAAAGLFFKRIHRLWRLMNSVQGHSEANADRIGARMRVLLVDVLGQANVRRKRGPGLAHAMIFYGFMAVQPHTIALIVQGVFPEFDLGRIAPSIYGAYLFTADTLAFIVLFGLGYSLYRRMVIRPKALTDGPDARWILLFTAVIIITFHIINAFASVRAGSAVTPAETSYTVSAVLARFFGIASLSRPLQTAGFEIAYWVHILTVLGFLAYIPGSKHLHILAAVPNIFFKPLELEKAMITTDIEDETAESFGLGNVSELSWKSVLDLYACTECGRCEEQCPAALTEKPLSPKRVVADVKHDLFRQADALLSGDRAAILPLIRNGSPLTEDMFWSCTTCRACEDICPVNIQHLDILMEVRKHRVLMEASFPAEMQEAFNSLENQSNPWGFAPDTRADWCKDMDVALMCDRPDADVLYFVGCAGSFDDRGKRISRALARVLFKAGVNFAILGHEERCNGDVARRAGNEYLAQSMIRGNASVIDRYRPKTILTACPHCFNSLKNEYPRFGSTYRVVHHSEYILDLVHQSRLKVNGTSLGDLAFHDSCYLGRWNGVFEAPRRLLSALNGTGRLIEPPRTRTTGLCCGAGGTRMFMEETIGRRINIERAEEMLATGVSTVVASCPFCVTMLTDGIADIGGGSVVKDLAEIVDDATL